MSITIETTITVRVQYQCDSCKRLLFREIMLAEHEFTQAQQPANVIVQTIINAKGDVAKDAESRGWARLCGRCRDPETSSHLAAKVPR
jgi:hypothetical protein